MTKSVGTGGVYPAEHLCSVSKGAGEPPLLLLHGWGGDENTLTSIAERFSGHRLTISLALPGFGKSPEPPVPWGTWDYVEAVHNWIAANFPDHPIDIIAHSFGGRIAIGLAARYPKSVNRLALIGSAGLRPKRPLSLKLKRFYSKQLRVLGQVLGGSFARKIEEKRQQLGSEDWRRASPLMRGTLSRVLDEDLSSDLKQIHQPTLLIWGKNDTATPVWMGKAMSLLILGSKLIEVKNAGHYTFLDRPGEVVSALWKHFELPEAW